MNLMKKNIILTFSIFMVLLAIGFGLFGYCVGGSFSDRNEAMAALRWSMEPSDDYDFLEPAEETNRFVADKVTEKHIIDQTGKIIEKLPGDEALCHGYYACDEDGLYGVADQAGKFLIEPEYAFIDSGDDYFVTNDEDYKVSFWNLDGECIYAEEQPSSAYDLGNNTFLVVQERDGKSYIFYADTGKKKPLSKYITYIMSDEQGGLICEIAGLYYPLNENFDVIEDGPIYEQYGELSEGLRYVAIYDEASGKSKHCYIDSSGEVIIPLDGGRIDSADPFHEGKAFLHKGSELVCIDKKGETIFTLEAENSSSGIQIFDEFYFSEGLAAVSLDNDMYGYVDENGTFVIPPVLDMAGEVRNGYAVARIYTDTFQYGILEIE